MFVNVRISGLVEGDGATFTVTVLVVIVYTVGHDARASEGLRSPADSLMLTHSPDGNG